MGAGAVSLGRGCSSPTGCERARIDGPSIGRRRSGGRRRRGDQAGLDLSMTVCAHQHALPRLVTVGRQRLPAGHGDPERFRRRVDMVEVQVDDAALVAAHGTAAAGFLDEDSLDLLVTARNRFPDAALAPPLVAASAGAVSMKLDQPVVAAGPKLGCARFRRRTTGLGDQRRGWRWSSRARHERMFANEPDVPCASAMGRFGLEPNSAE